nr:HPr family phosphocarrier protein [Marinicella sp. W31]MDC2878615.1 HPr family phosphocarrier protein [Marinicella sp. W31]
MGKIEAAAQTWVERKASVRISGGLHARPISEIIRIAKGFDAEVELATDVQQSSARSSLKLLLLGVKEGDTVIVRSRGKDADMAVNCIAAFLELKGSNDDDHSVVSPPLKHPATHWTATQAMSIDPLRLMETP